MNVLDILDDLVRSTSTYIESNLDTLSTQSLQVDSGGPIHYTKRKKYCNTKYAASTFTKTLKKNQLKHNKYLINWIITSLQSFSITEKESFIEMLKKFNPHYQVPNQQYISSCIIQTFQNQYGNLNEDLQNIS
ncbi:3860_t:CDS:2, partial [Cetraspora pellucida]